MNRLGIGIIIGTYVIQPKVEILMNSPNKKPKKQTKVILLNYYCVINNFF